LKKTDSTIGFGLREPRIKLVDRTAGTHDHGVVIRDLQPGARDVAHGARSLSRSLIPAERWRDPASAPFAEGGAQRPLSEGTENRT
jgi:hypothetical protein